jgi:signal peptidase II
MSKAWPWFALSAAIIAADQLAKWLVLGYFAGREPRVEVTGFFNLVLVCNKGAAFSFLAEGSGWQRWSSGVQRHPWPAAIAAVVVLALEILA